MKSLLKGVARVGLHRMGGLSALRFRHRRRFGVLMFHSFGAEDRGTVEAFCEHIARYFEPVPMSRISAALAGRDELPDNAVTVTVDDGYRNFLDNGHPIFRKYRIPTTLYVVSGFADGRLWLWTDQVAFGLLNAGAREIRALVGGQVIELSLTGEADRRRAIETLQDALMRVPNNERVQFMEGFGHLCGVEIPELPPADQSAMSWEDLRAVASEGVEIGSHTDTHPILSRVENAEDLSREIVLSKRQIEERLGLPVAHFCYPNGRPMDIGERVVRAVGEAGYSSAVTCTWGLGTLGTRPHEITRIPFDSKTEHRYGVEMLAGLHL